MFRYFSATELLSPPTERAAFSDRQAYVCAELSKLAYFKFEGGHTLDEVLATVRPFVDDDSRFELLSQRLSSALSAGPTGRLAARKAFTEILESENFQLLQTWSISGVQAFLCTRTLAANDAAEKSLGYLVFRGTETTDYRDILTDVRASLVPVELGDDTIELHSGYWSAYRQVNPEIEAALAESNIDQIFVTGHSLGGALAVVATRVLGGRINGACYTFGAPPVGASNVQNMLKTPVYQIINEIDIVPRLPNPWLTKFTQFLLRLVRAIAKLVTGSGRLLGYTSWDEKLERKIEELTRYRHPGYISYLVGAGSNARLRYNVFWYDRLQWWWSMIRKRRFGQFKKVLADHAIDAYIAKLKVHGKRRQ